MFLFHFLSILVLFSVNQFSQVLCYSILQLKGEQVQPFTYSFCWPNSWMKNIKKAIFSYHDPLQRFYRRCGHLHKQLEKTEKTSFFISCSAVFVIGPPLEQWNDFVGAGCWIEQNYLMFVFDPWYEFGNADKSAFSWCDVIYSNVG